MNATGYLKSIDEASETIAGDTGSSLTELQIINTSTESINTRMTSDECFDRVKRASGTGSQSLRFDFASSPQICSYAPNVKVRITGWYMTWTDSIQYLDHGLLFNDDVNTANANFAVYDSGDSVQTFIINGTNTSFLYWVNVGFTHVAENNGSGLYAHTLSKEWTGAGITVDGTLGEHIGMYLDCLLTAPAFIQASVRYQVM